jgi:hypothetical protein
MDKILYAFYAALHSLSFSGPAWNVNLQHGVVQIVSCDQKSDGLYLSVRIFDLWKYSPEYHFGRMPVEYQLAIADSLGHPVPWTGAGILKFFPHGSHFGRQLSQFECVSDRTNISKCFDTRSRGQLVITVKTELEFEEFKSPTVFTSVIETLRTGNG